MSDFLELDEADGGKLFRIRIDNTGEEAGRPKDLVPLSSDDEASATHHLQLPELRRTL